ncbi:MAG: DUF423 domain-containing protein [Bacteroidota bacterium]
MLIGIFLGALSIILGAFAAHGLENKISLDAQGTFETGAKYQMYHALLLILIGQLDKISEKSKKQLSILILMGVLFFSGSIYLLATNELTAFDFKVIGFVTPIGGLILIFSWMLLGYKIVKVKS